MAKGSYIGIGNVARKVKKIYVGIGGVARKVKKAYIGVAGKARLFFSGGELKYYGRATDYNTNNATGVSIGNYGLFCGGISNTSVVAYDTSLTKSTATNLSSAMGAPVSTNVGNYAIISQNSRDVNTYNTSLTRGTATAMTTTRSQMDATHVGNYALFAGGYNSGGNTQNAVDAYNSSLTHSVPTSLSTLRGRPAASSVGSYALIGGGSSTTVDTYNTSLTRSSATALSYDVQTGIGGSRTTNTNSYALFGANQTYSNINVYNASLTRTLVNGTKRINYAAVSVENYALFGGGDPYKNAYASLSTVEAYDDSLTKSLPTALSEVRGNLAGVSVGNYALFGGGVKNENMYLGVANVDAYVVD